MCYVNFTKPIWSTNNKNVFCNLNKWCFASITKYFCGNNKNVSVTMTIDVVITFAFVI